MNTKEDKQIKRKVNKSINPVIRICPICGKVDVTDGHEKTCNPVEEDMRRINDEHYD